MEKAELEVIVAAILGGAMFERCAEDKSAEGAIDCFTLVLRQMRTRQIMSNALKPKF